MVTDMRAKIIVKNPEGRILQLVDVPVDEVSVNEAVSCLRASYGQAANIDLSQIQMARQAMAA